jgi:hypothetical protein
LCTVARIFVEYCTAVRSFCAFFLVRAAWTDLLLPQRERERERERERALLVRQPLASVFRAALSIFFP